MVLQLSLVRGWWPFSSARAQEKNAKLVPVAAPAPSVACHPPSHQPMPSTTTAASVVVAFALGITAGYCLFLPTHRWRLRRLHRVARQRADPLWLLPSQTSPHVKGALQSLFDPRRTARAGQISKGGLDPASDSHSASVVATTSLTATVTWGHRLLRRVYRSSNSSSGSGSGPASTTLLEWAFLPVQNVALRPASHAVAAESTSPLASLWLLQKQTFNILYAPHARLPVWCGYYMAPDGVTRAKQQARFAQFFTDHSIPKAYRASLAEMKRTGYDRGHLAPHASVASTPQAAIEAALLTNVVLQHQGVNRGVWKQVERLAREYVLAASSGDLARTAPPPPASFPSASARLATSTRQAKATSRRTTSAKRKQPPLQRTKQEQQQPLRRRRRQPSGRLKTRKTTPKARQSGRARVRHARRPAVVPISAEAAPPRRGRGRPPRQSPASPTSAAAPAVRVSSLSTSYRLLSALMEASTPFSLTVATRARRQRRHARLSRLPLVGRAIVAACRRGEAWKDGAVAQKRARRGQYARQQPRLAVCTGPLFQTRTASLPRRRGRPPSTNTTPSTTSHAASACTTGPVVVPEAMFMAMWDPTTHNHVALIVPNDETGDVHPLAGRRARAGSACVGASTAEDWQPVLESFVVEWAELEARLTASTAVLLNRPEGSLACLRVFPHLQNRRLVRTAGRRWCAALRQRWRTWKVEARAWLRTRFGTLRWPRTTTTTTTTKTTTLASSTTVPIAVPSVDTAAHPNATSTAGSVVA